MLSKTRSANPIEAANRSDSVLNDTEKALNEFADRLDKTEADQIREKITTLREFVSKSQSGEGTATAAELKEKTDELQMASLNLFDKMHKARAESGEPNQETLVRLTHRRARPRTARRSRESIIVEAIFSIILAVLGGSHRPLTSCITCTHMLHLGDSSLLSYLPTLHLLHSFGGKMAL
jgi:hypothetical protein